ncbi:MAG: hypothetical protein IMF03_03875 [Proteobacteria bacterium]|nr:hypothetical protein [Pseudomonadota bacterium]
MIQFKSTQDLQQLASNDPAYPIIKQLTQDLIEAYTAPGHPYIPEDYGWVVLIEEGDVERVLTEIWDDWKLTDIPWEGAVMQGDFINAIFLANDDFGISFVIPNADWVQGKLRETLDEILEY